VVLSDSLNKSLVFFWIPIKEASLGKFSETILIFLAYNLECILAILNFVA
jgi:hypothetical protein